MNFRNTLIVTAIFVIALYRLFWHLGSEPVERWDERNNIRIVAELVENHSFPYLTYLGEPFFEKPPLWYFLTGILVSLFGNNLFTLRVVSALSGFFIFYLIWRISKKRYGEFGAIVSLLVLLTTNQLFQKNAGGYFSSHTFRSADLDSLQILFMILSYVSLSQFAKPGFRHILAGFGYSALSVLTKGPMGLLPPASYIIYILVSKKMNIYSIKQILIGAGGFLLILAPWYISMFSTFGFQFVSAHFGYNWVDRFSISLEGHTEPWWFYFQLLENKRVFLGFELLIFSVVSFFSLKKINLLEYDIYVPILQVILLLVILTLTQTKLTWYILPIYPFAALVIGNSAQWIYNQVSRKEL